VTEHLADGGDPPAHLRPSTEMPREIFIVDDLPRATLEKVNKANLRNRLALVG
jgi:hypothetical protein